MFLAVLLTQQRTTREKSADFSVPRKKLCFFLWKCGVSIKTLWVLSVLENSEGIFYIWQNAKHFDIPQNQRFCVKPSASQ